MSTFPRFDTILVATDFSLASQAALYQAEQLARHFHARIILVHVVDASSVDAEEMDITSASLQAMMESARADLRALTASLEQRQLNASWMVRHGNVRDAILESALVTRADLLVVGRKGWTLEGGSHYGRQVERLMRASTCPVLSVPARLIASTGEQERKPVFLVPVDFSDVSQAGFLYAVWLAERLGGTLVLAHAIDHHFPEPLANRWSHLRLQSVHAFLECAKSEHVDSVSVIETGAPRDILLHLADQRKPDYIVLGVRPPAQADGTRQGGLAETLLREVACPIFSISPDCRFRGKALHMEFVSGISA